LRTVDVGRAVAGLRHPRVAIATQLPLLRRRIAADQRDVIAAAVMYPATGRCAQLATPYRYVTYTPSIRHHSDCVLGKHAIIVALQ